ncbi:MAG: RNA methyltransferase [Roseburia sp.]|nr:RNA methyltransferase [Roseburia sp.]MCM1243004.1 RNA methyltransferase [Roseburia sp.]
MITSYANKSVKEVIQLIQKAKTRRERGLFVAEGVKMFLEAPVERIEKVYVSESFTKQMPPACKEKLALLRTPHEIVTDVIFEKMSDTKTPQGILCLVRQYQYGQSGLARQHGQSGLSGIEAMLTSPAPLLILLEDIQDPGNLGTIFRAGEGAGVNGIIMSGSTADIYNPKTIRSTMGSIYRMPFFYTPDMGGTIEELRRKDITVYAAHLQGATAYDNCCYEKGTAFLIGNEANGLREETAKKADRAVKIPMAGQVESLNAAVASAVLLFEAARQRRKA